MGAGIGGGREGSMGQPMEGEWVWVGVGVGVMREGGGAV